MRRLFAIICIALSVLSFKSDEQVNWLTFEELENALTDKPKKVIISFYADPGLDFATVRARPLAEIASTRHVMLVFQSQDSLPVESGADAEGIIKGSRTSTEIDGQVF